MTEPLMDVILGTALMLAITDNESWDTLSNSMKLRYIEEAVTAMIKAEEHKDD